MDFLPYIIHPNEFPVKLKHGLLYEPFVCYTLSMSDEIVTNTESENTTQAEPTQQEQISAPESPVETIPPTPNTTDSFESPTQPETQTAQLPPSEPITFEPEPIPESVQTDSVPAPVSAPTPISEEPISQPSQSSQPRNLAKELFAKAREAIQFRKRKKLDRVMALFAKRTNITNDEVEKFLHVSDATATRYLEILEKENKIKQSGKTGKGVTYIKI